MENMHHVEFEIKLTGSTFFDLHTRVTAKHICDVIPGLNYEVNDKELYLKIIGDLTDYWYEAWNKIVFAAGERSPEELRDIAGI